jgi:arginyl-tRNA--protein-N-Asp/Glu arginylyltransferase
MLLSVRSGSYLYKPDMRATCCPQYTIRWVASLKPVSQVLSADTLGHTFFRLKSSSFKPSKSQRQTLNKFNTFIEEGGKEGNAGFGTAGGSTGQGKGETGDAMMDTDAKRCVFCIACQLSEPLSDRGFIKGSRRRSKRESRTSLSTSFQQSMHLNTTLSTPTRRKISLIVSRYALLASFTLPLLQSWQGT